LSSRHKKVYFTRPDRRLNADQVAELRNRYNDGELLKVLAYDFGMCVRNVQDIARGYIYRDVHMDLVQDEPRRLRVGPKEAQQIEEFFAAGNSFHDAVEHFDRSEGTIRKFWRRFQEQAETAHDTNSRFRNENINHEQRGLEDGKEGAKAARDF